MRELVLVGVLFMAYKYGRLLASDRVSVAFDHAELVRHFQRALNFPDEAALQSAFSAPVLAAANVYYVTMHLSVTVAFLLWGWWCRPRTEYLWARNVMLVQTSLALVIHVLFPLAPPRMFPRWGFVDTMATIGPSAYDGASGAVANQFAAMPSLHIGWAVLIAYVVHHTGGPLMRRLTLTHALMTVVVVIITANHWWLDGLVAVALLAVGAATIRRPQSKST